jgi:hypothetical protein
MRIERYSRKRLQAYCTNLRRHLRKFLLSLILKCAPLSYLSITRSPPGVHSGDRLTLHSGKGVSSEWRRGSVACASEWTTEKDSQSEELCYGALPYDGGCAVRCSNPEVRNHWLTSQGLPISNGVPSYGLGGSKSREHESILSNQRPTGFLTLSRGLEVQGIPRRWQKEVGRLQLQF